MEYIPSRISKMSGEYLNKKQIEEIELAEFDREIQEGFAENMFCDNTGYCCGTSCRNYWKCQGE